MNARARPVLIAGAGIAGLTAALAFARHGFHVQVFEQAQRIEAVGAGLQLSPNATHILQRLGVLDFLAQAAVRPQAVVLKDAKSLRTLATVPLGEAAERRWQAPYLVAHRADLQQALLSRVAGEPQIELHTGARIGRVTTGERAVSIAVETDGKNDEVDGTLLVGADGVWSTIRTATGLGTQSRFTGELAWRSTIEASSPAGKAFAEFGAPDSVMAFLHPGFHLIAYPVSRGDAYNLVAFTKGERIAEGWSGKADPDILRQAIRGTSPALARLADEAGPWLAWPLHTVDRRASWVSSSGIALIGDAAHAMTPFAAQGAAMAIEDAATLADYVAGWANLPRALLAWERDRKPRVAKVARRGALNHLAWHAAGPVALARNLVLKVRAPESLAADLDWLYGWRPPQDI